MSDRRPGHAVEAFIASLQRAASTVTKAVMVRKPSPPGAPSALGFGDDTVRLRGANLLDLFVGIDYAVEEGGDRSARWIVRPTGYRFELGLTGGRMLLAYHWHPVGVSPVTAPHLHVGGPVAGVDLSKAHLPTGHVALQDVLRFAVLDLGVAPLRDDWRDVLATPDGTTA